MSHQDSIRNSLIDRLGGVVLLLICLQIVNAHVWGMVGWLAWSWIGTLLLVTAAVVAAISAWRSAVQTDHDCLIAAWKAFAPWLILGILCWQVIVYPPTMHDSLCYRLPRIFLWLQDGALVRQNAPDARIVEMPWNWELLALPVIAIKGVVWVAFINLLVWVAAYQLLHHHASARSVSPAMARWLALAMAGSPVFLLQASSTANDLFAAVMLMFSLHYILSFSKRQTSSAVIFSLLALILACGTKPHFLVLAPAWGIWWLLDSSKPWKHSPPKILIPVVFLALLVSPLPVMVQNQIHSGSWFGSNLEAGMQTGPPLLNIMAAGIQFAVAQIQLPIMPMADRVNSGIAAVSWLEPMRQSVPKFAPSVNLVPIIDRASLGLLHSLMIIGGLIAAVRSGAKYSRWIILSAAVGFFLAATQVVPDTIGRSFLGFAAILLIPAVIGLAQSGQVPLKAIAIVVTLTGALAMVLNPSAPAWPSKAFASAMEQRGNTAMAGLLGSYHAYQQRAATGSGMLDTIPAGDKVAVLVRGLTPLVRMWTPDWQRHRIEFVHDLPVSDFLAGDHNWLLIGGNAAETYPEQYAAYRSMTGWHQVRSVEYLHVLSRGPETWVLLERAKK